MPGVPARPPFFPQPACQNAFCITPRGNPGGSGCYPDGPERLDPGSSQTRHRVERAGHHGAGHLGELDSDSRRIQLLLAKTRTVLASFQLTFHPKLPWMRQKTCCPVLGTCRPCNNPASFWVLTAMRPSTLRGKRSDPEQRGVKRFLYGRSAMIFDFHSSRALFRPTSLITLPSNHAGSTTSG